jgi:hypothetical protein
VLVRVSADMLEVAWCLRGVLTAGTCRRFTLQVTGIPAAHLGSYKLSIVLHICR